MVNKFLPLLLFAILLWFSSCSMEDRDSFWDQQERRLLSTSSKEFDYPYKWVPCCDKKASKDFGDPKTNFVLPVTTSGRSYSLFQAIASLNDAASSSRLFRYVEPFALLSDSKVKSPEVVPLRRLLKFDGLRNEKQKYPQYISLNEWGSIVGIHNTSASEMLVSFQKSLIFIEFFALPPGQLLSCKTEFEEKVCMRMVQKRHGGSSLQLQYLQAEKGKFDGDMMKSLFMYVLDSYWAKETGFNSEAPITLGFTEQWLSHTLAMGLLPPSDDSNSYSISYVQRKETPLFAVSDYMLWNADTVLKQLVRPRIMVAWSLEDHLQTLNASHPGINVRIDEMGFFVGCQINSICASLSDVASQNILFSFDIFHTNEHPTEKQWEEVKVSSFTRRDVIHALRDNFSKFSVVQHLARKGRFVQLDPYNLFKKGSKDMFYYWLDIAIGRQIEQYVSVAGDMDNTIRILRGNSKAVTFMSGGNCASAAHATDDQILMLEHSDDGMKRMIDEEGGEKFFKQTFVTGYADGTGKHHRTPSNKKANYKRTPAAEKLRRKGIRDFHTGLLEGQ